METRSFLISANTVDPRFNEYRFKRIPRYIKQNLLIPSFLAMKTLIQNLGLANTFFNKFLIISNKNICFLLKFYHGFSKQYHTLSLEVYLQLLNH